MKRLFIFFTFFPIFAFSQSKKELENELKQFKVKYDSLQSVFYQQQSLSQQRIAYLEATIDKIKFVVGGINLDVQNNSSPINYSNHYGVQNNSSNSVTNNSNFTKRDSIGNGLGDGLTPRTGATIYTGSRGGQYYINKNGNKTYIRRKN